MTTLWSSSKCIIYTVIGAFVLIIVTLIVTFMHHGSTSPQPHPAPPPGLGAAVVRGASEGNSATERTSGTTQQPGSDAVPGLVSETPPGGGGSGAGGADDTNRISGELKVYKVEDLTCSVGFHILVVRNSQFTPVILYFSLARHVHYVFIILISLVPEQQ